MSIRRNPGIELTWHIQKEVLSGNHTEDTRVIALNYYNYWSLTSGWYVASMTGSGFPPIAASNEANRL